MAGPILCNYKQQGSLTYLTDDQGSEFTESDLPRAFGLEGSAFEVLRELHAPLKMGA